PSSLAISAIIDGVNQLIVVVVANTPFHANRFAVMNRISLRIESLARIKADRTRRRLVAHSRSDSHVVKLRSNILLQIIQSDAINTGRSLARVKNGFPLYEPSRWSRDFRVFLKINSFPGTPVAVRIVNIAGAREEFD